ncbi:MAG: hypothetical protein ACI4EA_04975, partial [Candidatus Ornithomonoglobus sp.]
MLKNEIKSNIHVFSIVIFMILSAVNCTVAKGIGYSFVPANYQLYFVGVLMLFIAYAVAAIVLRKRQTRESRVIGALSIAFLLIYFISLISVTEVTKKHIRNPDLFFLVFCCIIFIIWAVIFYQCVKNKIYIGIVTSLLSVLAIFMGFFIFIAAVFGSFGAEETIDNLYSPDGTCY